MAKDDPYRHAPSSRYLSCTVIWTVTRAPRNTCSHPKEQVLVTLNPVAPQRHHLTSLSPEQLRPGLAAECTACGEEGFTAIRIRRRR